MFHMFWFTWYGGDEHVPPRAEVVQGPGAAPETSAVVPHAASTVAIRPSAMLRPAARASPSHHCQKPRIFDLSRRTDIGDPPGSPSVANPSCVECSAAQTGVARITDWLSIWLPGEEQDERLCVLVWLGEGDLEGPLVGTAHDLQFEGAAAC